MRINERGMKEETEGKGRMKREERRNNTRKETLDRNRKSCNEKKKYGKYVKEGRKRRKRKWRECVREEEKEEEKEEGRVEGEGGRRK